MCAPVNPELDCGGSVLGCVHCYSNDPGAAAEFQHVIASYVSDSYRATRSSIIDRNYHACCSSDISMLHVFS